jgi:nucleoid-associated protein YgaU
MRFIRVSETFYRYRPYHGEETSVPAPDPFIPQQSDEDMMTYRVNEGDRIDLIAEQFLGSPSKWRIIADENDLGNPHAIEEGALLRIPGTA